MKKIILLCIIFSFMSSFAAAEDGTLTYPNGSKYAGQIKNDRRHGYGTYTYPDGSKYVGQWKDSKYNGKGILYDASGNEYQKGIFQNDEFIGK